MDSPNMDMEMFEALLASMSQSLPQGGNYDDVDDDDDDDYDDDEDDDDDDDYDYNQEHSIHTMANPYSGGGGGDDMGGVSLPTMQTMSILQGLLNMNPNALQGGVQDLGGAIGGMGGMGSAMEGGAGSFLNNIPSFLPAGMNTEMAGSLAGAFAGGMNALMDGFAGAGNGASVSEYNDDDILTEDEDEEDDEDDDVDDEDLHERSGLSSAAAVAAVGAVGAVGGMMASRLLGSNHGPTSPMPHQDLPALPPPAHPAAHGSRPHIGFNQGFSPADLLAVGAPHSQLPPSIAGAPSSLHHTAMAPSMSGGSVRSVDPLAGVPLGLAGVAAGAGILAPVVSGLLNATKTLPANLDTSGASSVTLVDDSLNNSTKTLPANRSTDSADLAAAALEKTHISSPPKDQTKQAGPEGKTDSTKDDKNDPKNPTAAAAPKKDTPEKAEEERPATKGNESNPANSKDDPDDDKASVGSSVPGSEGGDGKSDTESVRKKTPSPVLAGKLGRLSPTGSETTPVLENASCASITDLASATESMRDSDTDNHSDAHNVTANLSDLDNDIHETQPKVHAVQPLPMFGDTPLIMEHPNYGWQGMMGLETAKDALKNLFMSEAFPEVYEGTQGSCRGVLLFGPSGSGKTSLGRALANEANGAYLIAVSARYLTTELAPMDAPKMLRYLFDTARQRAPTVILIDEVDLLCMNPSHEGALRTRAELLAQIRGLTRLNPQYPHRMNSQATYNDGLMVIGTTNMPWLLLADDELRRIFTYNIHVKLPAEKEREALFRMFLQQMQSDVTDDHYKCLIAKSEGYSAAEINHVIRQASLIGVDPNKPIHTLPRHVTFDNLATVMTDYRARFTEELSIEYQKYIKAATHRSEERREDKDEKKGKPKGVKKFGQRIANSIAAALVAVID